MNETEIERRLTGLEIKIAYLEDFVQQIQKVAVEQERTIDKLQKENKLILEKMRELSGSLEDDIPNRKPPHY